MVTISQRGNPNNFSHYKLISPWSFININSGVYTAGFQAVGVNNYSFAYDSGEYVTTPGGKTPWDGNNAANAVPSGWIIAEHPGHVALDPAGA